MTELDARPRTPGLLRRVALRWYRISGLTHADERRLPGPEGNARVTSTAALVLAVLLLAELVTIASINRFVFWHIAIGFVLLPVAALKLGSVSWRFVRYYLDAPAYRAAGPPAPLPRVLGPLLYLSTIAMLGSGVWLFAVGPGAGSWLYWLHKGAFAAWIVCLGLHVIVHGRHATAMARRDLGRSRRRRIRHQLPGARLRQLLVLASLGAGVGLLVVTRVLTGPWAAWIPRGLGS